MPAEVKIQLNKYGYTVAFLYTSMSIIYSYPATKWGLLQKDKKYAHLNLLSPQMQCGKVN